MIIKKPQGVKGSEITGESTYLDRRQFMRGAVLAGTLGATGLLYRKFFSPGAPPTEAGEAVGGIQDVRPAPDIATPEGERLTSFEDITNYNNFYEFSTDKRAVAGRAQGFITRPWTVSVEGLVNRPKVFDLDDLLKIAPPEERVYRLRCVEGWSMVIPWIGFPLRRLLDEAQPNSSARFVEFVTLNDPERMPNLRSRILNWPYVEGLRLDEALHPLTILATGLYGKQLLPQNGAPIRLVVPWKYGFKSIKSIVAIRLVGQQPRTSWSDYAPREYGFYSNVNPDVDHPRWSQASERRIGEYGMRATLPFNGYADQVAHLYEGMDLSVYY